MDSDVRYVEISDDLTAICYESDEKLYRIRNLGNRQEIATDVYDYEMVEETGSIYYLSNPANNSGPASSGVGQWFEDDMAVSDASLEIPDKALYPTAVTA